MYKSDKKSNNFNNRNKGSKLFGQSEVAPKKLKQEELVIVQQEIY